MTSYECGATDSPDEHEDPGYYTHTDLSQPLVVPPTGANHTATVILLHGAGDTGPGIAQWIAQRRGFKPLTFPHVKVIFPSASPRSYSPARGDCTVWFDFPKGIHYDVPEDTHGMDASIATVNALIDGEIQKGIPAERIVLGGLSQGGIMALHVGLTSSHTLAGIFALSSYLPEESALLQKLKSAQSTSTPVYMAHGDEDNLIREKWGRLTVDRLGQLGIPPTYKHYPGLGHDMSQQELIDLKTWIMSRIPQN